MQRDLVPIDEFLTQPAIQQWFKEQLESVREQLTVPIGKVSSVINVPETRLRYWESLDLLSPARAAQPQEEGKRRAGQRYYDIDQLARALLINKLVEEKRYSLAEIVKFMQREETLIKDLITVSQVASSPEPESPPTIMERITAAEAALMWEFFLPRALYAALSLLVGRAFPGEVRLYLPIPSAGMPVRTFKTHHSTDLSQLGRVLLGWRDSSHAFAALPVAAPPIEPPGKYEIIPLEEILPEEATVKPVGAHLAWLPQFASILEQADKQKPASASARRVAVRLLKFLQDNAAEWEGAIKARGETLLFDSPLLTNVALGGPLLNVMANTLIALGSTPAKPWKFCCIMLPEDMLAPLMQRNLVVRGQSAKSPYGVGETRLSPKQVGISILAYQSGIVIYRPHVTDEDPAITWREREDISGGSAIAVPIEGEYGKALGAIYVASAQPQAFPLESQQLIRIVGRMISEQVMASRGRQLITENLSDLINEPQTVESLFKGMQSINKFRRNLAYLLEELKENPQALDELGLLAVDITDLSGVALKYGDQAATKNLVREVGERIEAQARHVFTTSSNIECYHAYVDRFYLLLRNFSASTSGRNLNACADDLKQRLETSYSIYAPRVLPTQSMLPAYSLILDEVKMRVGITAYKRDELEKMIGEHGIPWAIDHLESNLNASLPIS